MGDALLATINIVGAVQAAFLAAALLHLPGRHTGANRVLAALMAVFALMFAYDVLYHYDLVLAAPLLVFARLPLIFLYGPLFWLYLRRISADPGQKFPTNSFLHFLPFGIAVLVYAPALTLSADERIQLITYADLRRQYGDALQLSVVQQWILTITPWRMPAFVLQFSGYLVLSFRLLAKHRQRVAQHFSYTEKVSLNWVRYLLLMVVSMWLLVPLKEFVFAGRAARWISDFLVVEQVGFVFLIGLFGMLQVRIFADSDGPTEPPLEPALSEKYQRSALIPAQIEEGLSRLLHLMEAERLYLDGDLTLSDLAGRLGLAPRHLSQIINGRLDKNFMDFVNGYRVEAAKRHLDDLQSTRSVLDVAMDVGFNSKSAFYNAFKRHVGITPTQYRQCRALLVESPAS